MPVWNKKALWLILTAVVQCLVMWCIIVWSNVPVLPCHVTCSLFGVTYTDVDTAESKRSSLALLAMRMGKMMVLCCADIAALFFWFVQNIVLSGGSTMFKDFGRRLQRDIKRRADSRMEANRRITMQVYM